MRAELPVGTKLRSSKYLNNLIEQDRRGVKIWIGPMLGFKQFRTAVARSLALNCSVGSTRDSSTSGLRFKGKNAPAVWNGDAIKLTSSHPQLGHPFLRCYLHRFPQAAGIIHRTYASVEATLAGAQLDLVSIATPPATRQAAAAACIKVADEEMEAINIPCNHFHGEWD